MGLALTRSRLFVTNQLLQILDQVVELLDLNEVLNDIARVEETYSLNVLLDRFVILLLLEQFISVLLDNLALDLSRKICLLRYCLGLSIVRLLH